MPPPPDAQPPVPPADEGFSIENFDVQIHCPECGQELVHDGSTLILAESPRGSQFECGRCATISEWRFTWQPFTATRVPVVFGGEI